MDGEHVDFTGLWLLCPLNREGALKQGVVPANAAAECRPTAANPTQSSTAVLRDISFMCRKCPRWSNRCHELVNEKDHIIRVGRPGRCPRIRVTATRRPRRRLAGYSCGWKNQVRSARVKATPRAMAERTTPSLSGEQVSTAPAMTRGRGWTTRTPARQPGPAGRRLPGTGQLSTQSEIGGRSGRGSRDRR